MKKYVYKEMIIIINRIDFLKMVKIKISRVRKN